MYIQQAQQGSYSPVCINRISALTEPELSVRHCNFIAFNRIVLVIITGAVVTMSSTLNPTDFNGSKVVDGIYAPIDMPEQTSLAHTNNDHHPWIQIKLYQNFCVSAVKIWNRNKGGDGRYE